MKKTVAGQSTLFFYDAQGKLITEIGNAAADYLYLKRSPIAKAEGSSIYYYHTDHLGTPQRMTDAGKIVIWAGEFKPFGETVSITGTIVNNLRFPGQYNDGETRLNYNYFRFYNPSLARFVESDPVGIKRGKNHLYVYVQNNPVNSFDLNGLSASNPSAEEIKTWRERFDTFKDIYDECKGNLNNHEQCSSCCKKISTSIYGGNIASPWWTYNNICMGSMCTKCPD